MYRYRIFAFVLTALLVSPSVCFLDITKGDVTPLINILPPQERSSMLRQTTGSQCFDIDTHSDYAQERAQYALRELNWQGLDRQGRLLGFHYVHRACYAEIGGGGYLTRINMTLIQSNCRQGRRNYQSIYHKCKLLPKGMKYDCTVDVLDHPYLAMTANRIMSAARCQIEISVPDVAWTNMDSKNSTLFGSEDSEGILKFDPTMLPDIKHPEMNGGINFPSKTIASSMNSPNSPTLHNEDFNEESRPGLARVAALVGGLSAADRNDSHVKEIVDYAINEYANRLNSPFHLTLVELKEVTKQIISGVKYYIDAVVANTDCIKTEEKEHCTVSKVNPGFSFCKLQVWEQPWLNKKALTSHDCLFI